MTKKKSEKYDLVTPQVTPVFIKNMECKAPVIVNRGGAGSSKTHSLSQFFIYKFLTEQNKKILIVRKALPSLRLSVQTYLERVFDDFGVRNRIKEEKVMMNYRFGTNLIHLGSVDDPQKIKCGIAGTEVLTSKGFKDLSKVEVGELVASMNPLTKEVGYYPITKYFEYDYDGDIYVPDRNKIGCHVDFGFTPEHKFIGKSRVHKGTRKKYYFEFNDPSFVEAKNLPTRFYIPRGGKWTGELIESYSIPNTSINKNFDKTTTFPIVPWLKFLGWYISEGNVAGTSIQISQTKPEGIKTFKEDMKDFPKEYNINYTSHSFRLQGRSIADYLKGFGKYCHEKRIPREILDLHPSLLIHLFNSLMAGDGTKHKSGRYVYGTTSEGLKEDVCELSLKLGLTPTVMEPKTNYKSNYANARKFWQISISKQNEIAIKKPVTKKYKGKVYCVEVEPYHTILTRLNGKTIWTGNSSEWNYAWMEEATEFKYEDFQLIRSYTRAPTFDGHPNQVILSFNPIDEAHWIKTELLDKHEDVTEIRSTYKDNPFLPDEAIKFYEDSINYDINFYRIYALGEWGKLEDLIYNLNSWDTCKEMPDLPNDIYGLDFGFNSPSALTHGVYKEREVWEEVLLYKTGLTNSQLIEELKKVIPENKRNRPIYADSAEPDRIKEIRQAGFNCKQALKDVKDGIDFVKRMKVHIVESSLEMIKEKRSYSYKKDTKRNLILDEPIPFNDHTCVLPNTIIITDKGIKKIEDITTDDLVLTHKGNFKKVKKIFIRNVEEKILNISSSGRMPLGITKNHPLLLNKAKRFFGEDKNNKICTGQLKIQENFSFTKGEDIILNKKKTEDRVLTNIPRIKQEEDFILDMKKYLPSNWIEINGKMGAAKNINIKNSFNVKSPVIDRFILLSKEICFMIGYFVAEGSKSGNVNTKGNRKGVQFAGHIREKNVTYILKKVFDLFDVKKIFYNESKFYKSRTININSTPIYYLLEQCLKEENKRFPDFCFNLNKENTLFMLAGYMFGDGCFIKAARTNGISIEAQYQILIMLVKLGYLAHIRKIKRKKGKEQFGIDLSAFESKKLLKEFFKYDELEFVFEDKRKELKE
ncbi:MAG: phage terminase large subunit, partial [Candidatus Omnitrophota bacterium]